MVHELCMRLQEKLNKLPLNIEVADCCLLMMLFAVIFKMILYIARVVKNCFVSLKTALMKCNMLTYLRICNVIR